jgi:hypothetical protein
VNERATSTSALASAAVMFLFSLGDLDEIAADASDPPG